MPETRISLPTRPLGATERPDACWLRPVAVLLGLSAFAAYSMWAA